MNYVADEVINLMKSYDIKGEINSEHFGMTEISSAIHEGILIGAMMASNDRETRNEMLASAADQNIKPSFYKYSELTR